MRWLKLLAIPEFARWKIKEQTLARSRYDKTILPSEWMPISRSKFNNRRPAGFTRYYFSLSIPGYPFLRHGVHRRGSGETCFHFAHGIVVESGGIPHTRCRVATRGCRTAAREIRRPDAPAGFAFRTALGAPSSCLTFPCVACPFTGQGRPLPCFGGDCGQRCGGHGQVPISG